MDKFLICFNDTDKVKLEQNGYKLLKEDCINGTKRYTFINESNTKLNFSENNMKVFMTNKLYL